MPVINITCAIHGGPAVDQLDVCQSDSGMYTYLGFRVCQSDSGMYTYLRFRVCQSDSDMYTYLGLKVCQSGSGMYICSELLSPHPVSDMLTNRE